MNDVSTTAELKGSDGKSDSTVERIYSVDLDKLSDAERKSYARSILHCFAALRNKWSSYEEIASVYKKLKPWLERAPLKNVKENVCDWNRKSKKMGFGDNHLEDDEKTDGCTLQEIHRICKKTDDTGEERFRIHPLLAEIVFSEGDRTVDDIVPLPIRMTKRKFDEVEEDGVLGDSEKMIKLQVSKHRRIVRRLKMKLEETKNMVEEYRQSRNLIADLEEELDENAISYGKKLVRRKPVQKTKTPKKRYEEDDESELESVGSSVESHADESESENDDDVTNLDGDLIQ
jgi:hypothetical protein